MKIITFALKILHYLFNRLKPEKSTVIYNQIYILDSKKSSYNGLNSKLYYRLSNHSQITCRTHEILSSDKNDYLMENKIDLDNEKKHFVKEDEAITLDNYFSDIYSRDRILMSLDDTAEELNLSLSEFICYLLKYKFVYLDPHHKIVPYQKFIMDGIFEIRKIKSSDNNSFINEIFVTLNGIKMLRTYLKYSYF